MNKTGFTLIELIIVIAVIAILATTVILVINPAKILAEARDSQRLADLSQIDTALKLYLTSGSSSLCAVGNNNCYVHSGSSVTGDGCGDDDDDDPATTNLKRHSSKALVSSSDRTVGGTGWIPVNLGADSALPSLPVDPKNNTEFYYSFACDGSTYVLKANMESDRYKNGGNDDKESTDGGPLGHTYEVGNNLSL